MVLITQVLKVIELLLKPAEVSDTVAVTVVEGANVDLVDHRVLVPKHVLL